MKTANVWTKDGYILRLAEEADAENATITKTTLRWTLKLRASPDAKKNSPRKGVHN